MSAGRTGTALPELRDLDAYRAAEEISLNRSILIAVACGLMTFEQVEAKMTEIYRKRLEAASDADLPQVGSFHG